MKAQIAPRVGIIDALAAGLSCAWRHPWLMVIPVAIDAVLWLMPRLSVGQLLSRLLTAWEAWLNAIYTPAQLAAIGDVLNVSRDAVTQMGQQADVAMTLTAGWLVPTSALASVQANRLLLVSDGVLAPVGIGLRLPGALPLERASGAIEIGSLGGVVLIGIVLWLAAQVLATYYLRAAALSLDGVAVDHSDHDSRTTATPIRVIRSPFLRTFGQLLGLSILLGVVLLFLRVPLAVVMALTVMSGSSGAALLLALSGGITLWLTLSFLVSMFLASDAILLEGQGFWQSIWRSLILARNSGLRTLGFVVLINLLMLGARAVWGLIGQAPVGTAASILGNGYLVTGMVLASMVYYDGLRREWQGTAAGKTSTQ